MNIFFLDPIPRIAAAYHCDKHVVKMIVETAQMLSTTHRILDENCNKNLYKKTHPYHPMNQWIIANSHNYEWTYRLYISLLDEYTKRYGKIHSSSRLKDLLRFPPKNIGKERMKTPLCMPDYCKTNNLYQSYKNYYLMEKAHFAKWKNSQVPEWWKPNDQL